MMNMQTNRQYSHLHDKQMKGKTTEWHLSWLGVTIIVVAIFAMLHPIYEAIVPWYAGMYQFKMNYIGGSSYGFVALPYLLTISLFLYRQQRRASLSDYFLIILTLCYYLPSNVLYLFGNWSNQYYLFHFLAYLSLALLNELIPNFTFKVSKKLAFKNKDIIRTFAIIIPLSVIIITFSYNGLQINLDLENVYELRSEWSSSSMPNIFNYYLPYAARITPILLVITLAQRRVWLSALLIFSQLVSFSFGGMKYTLFALVLGILFFFFGKNINPKKIIIYFTLFVCVCLVECLIFKEQPPMFTAYSIRRISFIPNQIGYYFFSFSQTYGYLYFSESFLRGFLDYPYSDAFPHVIGNYAFGLSDMGANTGLFAEGFSQVGWLALPIYSTLYILTFRLYSACANGFKNTSLSYVPLLGVLLYTSTITDGSFFSVLLTQGGIITALTLIVLSRHIAKTSNGK